MAFYKEWETEFRNMEDLFRTMSRDPNLAIHKIEDMFEEGKQALQDLKDDWRENSDEIRQEFIDKYGPEEGLEKYENAAEQIENIDPAIMDQITGAWHEFTSTYDSDRLSNVVEGLGDKMQEEMRNNPDMAPQEMQHAFQEAMLQALQEHGYYNDVSYSNESPDSVTAEMQQRLESQLDKNPELTNAQSLQELTVGGASAIKAPFNAHVNGLGTSAQPGLEQNIQPEPALEADTAPPPPEVKPETMGM